jgi:RecA-family ATPase
LVAREFKEPKWAVPDVIPEGLAILGGRPKTGKSWLALDIAIAIAGGYRAFSNLQCPQGDVLLLGLEDTERRLHQRLKAVLQGQPAPSALEIATQWRRADAAGLDDLRVWLATHPNARLVVIDTLQKIRGARRRDDGVYADDYAAIGQLKALADEFNVPFLLLHHLRKEDASDPLDAISGTAGITGSADTILVLKREPKDPLGRLYVRGRDVPEDEIAMQFDEQTGKWLRVIGADDFRLSKERREIIRTLEECAPEALLPSEIAGITGMRKNNTWFLLHKMRKSGEVLRLSNGRYKTP